MSPSSVFAFEFLLLAPLVVGLEYPGVEPAYLVASPLILFLLVAANLVLATHVSRGFSMDENTRRNHVLGHATVLSLRSLERGIGGRAQKNGFRVFGAASMERVKEAFESVALRVNAGHPVEFLSEHCGSNRVTILAFAITGLLLVTAAAVTLRPAFEVRVASLAGILLLFATARKWAGNWFQRRFFMLNDIGNVELASIREVPAEPLRERSPVFFLETRVTPRPMSIGNDVVS